MNKRWCIVFVAVNTLLALINVAIGADPSIQVYMVGIGIIGYFIYDTNERY